MNRVDLLVCAVLFGLPGQTQNLGPGDTFAAARLTSNDVRQIVAAIDQSAYDTAASWNTELRVKRVDLGNGAGLVLRGTDRLCGGTGNCQVVVLHKEHGRSVSPFGDAQAPIGESLQFGPGIAHGVKDLTVTANTGAQAGQTVTYQFDGRRYRTKRRGSRGASGGVDRPVRLSRIAHQAFERCP